MKLLEILTFSKDSFKDSFKDSSKEWYIINNNNSILDHLENKEFVKEVREMLNINENFEENKYSLVFSDIFIDMSFDYNNQEQLYFKYFLYSVINAIKLNDEKGTFICRIYDTITKPTVQLITILTLLYNDILFIKPRMSYCASTEKFIVCSGFSSLKKEIVLKRLMMIYNGIKVNFCRDLFVLFPEEVFLERNNIIIDMLSDYNNRLIKNEINLLENVINTSSQSYIYTKLLESYQQKISHEFVEIFGISKKDSDISISDCRHFTKNLSSMNKCEKCFKYWV